MKPQFYEATIQFLDDNSIVEGMIFKQDSGTDEQYDDHIFYYLGTDNIEMYKQKGIADFIVLDYEPTELI